MGHVDKPFVTIAMPALNEERYIARALLSLSQTPASIDCEILVLDGGSTDYTTRIVEVFAQADARIRLLANDRRIQAAAVNRAATEADPRSCYLMRADCHADYPPGFVESCIRSLEQNGADSVVVRMQTVGATCFQKAVAMAQNSRLGNGGSAHRVDGKSRFVDHGHHAAFRRKVFLAVGGYDESFSHNEDAEFDVRLRNAGGRIWLNTDAAINYFPRSSVSSLAKQYLQHGRGRAKTIFKHRMKPKLRQILPLGAAAAFPLGVIGAIADPHFLFVPIVYVLAALFVGVILAVKNRSLCGVASGFVSLVMHISWAVGFATTAVSSTSRTIKNDGHSKPRTPSVIGPV